MTKAEPEDWIPQMEHFSLSKRTKRFRRTSYRKNATCGGDVRNAGGANCLAQALLRFP